MTKMTFHSIKNIYFLSIIFVWLVNNFFSNWKIIIFVYRLYICNFNYENSKAKLYFPEDIFSIYFVHQTTARKVQSGTTTGRLIATSIAPQSSVLQRLWSLSQWRSVLLPLIYESDFVHFNWSSRIYRSVLPFCLLYPPFLSS